MGLAANPGSPGKWPLKRSVCVLFTAALAAAVIGTFTIFTTSQTLQTFSLLLVLKPLFIMHRGTGFRTL